VTAAHQLDDLFDSIGRQAPGKQFGAQVTLVEMTKRTTCMTTSDVFMQCFYVRETQ
jgi:hypothetical protein